MKFHASSGRPDWIGLGEAARLLGVAPGTLRRWSDSGRVRAFTTPGGHRRFIRSALERLIATEDAVRPSVVSAGMTPSRLARAYRTQARAAATRMPWLVELDPEQRAWFREHGRTLAASLLAHLDAADQSAAETRLGEATGEAANYGRMASAIGLSLSESVEGFLDFRRPFLHELALVARRRGFDTGGTADLLEAADRAMDRLLVAAMAAHSVDGVRRVRRGRAARPARRVAEAGS